MTLQRFFLSTKICFYGRHQIKYHQEYGINIPPESPIPRVKHVLKNDHTM
jgi:hypothetical protein